MASPFTILVDARSLVDPNAGGVGRVARRALAALVLQADGAHFAFVTTGAVKPALPEPFASQASVTHVHIPIPNKIWSAMCMFGITSLDREAARRAGKSADAVLLPNIGFVGRLAVPYALILHDLSFLIEPRWFTPRMRLWHRAVNASGQIRRAVRLFCVSETTARDAERLLNIPRDRLEVFHPGTGAEIETGNLEPRSHNTGQEFPVPYSQYVLAFNDANPRKNIGTAVAAVSKLREDPEFSDLRLVIIGPDPNRSPLTADRTAPWITRLSHIDDAALSDLYSRASALLYPSWYEGFGLPLHEAARYGTPCLASVHGALPETAPQGTLLIPPAKPHLWAAALCDVLRCPELYRTVSDPADEQPRMEGLLDWIGSVSGKR